MSSSEGRRRGCLLPFGSVLIAVSCGWTPPVAAQTCENQNFVVENTLSQSLQVCDVRLVYKTAAVAGGPAVPALRALHRAETAPGGKPRCGTLISQAVETALAKLGDESAFQQIAREFKESGGSHSRLQDLRFIGDDHALSVMLAYFADHPKLMGSDDLPTRSTQLLIIDAIGDIHERRILPDVASGQHHPAPLGPLYGPGPPRWTADELILAWKEWWDAHRGERIAVAPYESVSDPYLRCLAREVDWGFAGAILAIADRGGDEAKSVLERFPNSTNHGLPTIPGLLCEARAKLGDKEKWKDILQEWERGSDFTDAIEKLEYIGGKEPVGLFIARCDLLARRVEAATKEREQCVQGLVERQELKPGKSATKYIQESWCQQNYDVDMKSIQLQQKELLDALVRMVKDPPLPVGTKPTFENVRIWQDWWARNKDTAQFVSGPVGTQE